MAKVIINLSDVEALAERLLARGRSRLAESGMESDSLLAGKILCKRCRSGSNLSAPFSLDDD
jgi:hypothetical protein